MPDSSGTTSADPMPAVTLFSDGACLGNPGPGGWAYILRHPLTGKEKEAAGGERRTTNNRMELLAVIRGLEALSRPSKVTLVSDSQYVLKGLKEWMPGWKKKNWTKRGGPIKNLELWKELDQLAAEHEVIYQWIRGHTGHAENERCDQLAKAEAERFR